MNPDLRKKVFRKFKSVIGEKNTRTLQYLPFRLYDTLNKQPRMKVGNCEIVAEHGLFINGWILEGNKAIKSLEIDLGAGKRIELTEFINRIPRLDIQRKYGLSASSKPGFVCFVPFDGNSISLVSRAVLVVNLEGGKKLRKRIRVTTGSNDPLTSIKRVLSAIPSPLPHKRDLFDSAYGPAIKSMWSLRKDKPVGSELVSYNSDLAPTSPDVSLIIPIYGRYDFIEYQLSQFVNDKDMMEYEIIYVIDDPRIRGEIEIVSSTYEKLYGIAFKVLHLERNTGFAGANNAGVLKAKAPLILMLNSDVMPSESGWLRKLLRSSNGTVANSVIGARLLYEDDSIQHDGMQYYSSPFVNHLWTNIHPAKGFPSNVIPVDSRLTEVEAVTGACILVSKANYELLSGLDEDYILGDYEDSDFCIRARKLGLKILMNQHVTLYHLERQSQSLVSADSWKEELTYYNCWQHTNKWDTEIQSLKFERTERELDVSAL